MFRVLNRAACCNSYGVRDGLIELTVNVVCVGLYIIALLILAMVIGLASLMSGRRLVWWSLWNLYGEVDFLIQKAGADALELTDCKLVTNACALGSASVRHPGYEKAESSS